MAGASRVIVEGKPPRRGLTGRAGLNKGNPASVTTTEAGLDWILGTGHRVARPMRENGLRALHGHRTRRWEVSKPAVMTLNLLKRQFEPTQPNVAWATDITYIRTWQSWLYLAVVLDRLSRKVVGWAAGPTIHRELVLNALAATVKQRRLRGTINPSDQGTQYGSDA